MRLLLDTHIWLWSHGWPEKLKPRVARALRNPKNELWFSPISTWEIALLTQRRQVRLDPNVETWFTNALARLPLKEAPITHEIASEVLRVALPHQDPTDRFLVATAKVLRLTLVTSDENILSVPGLPVLSNR